MARNHLGIYPDKLPTALVFRVLLFLVCAIGQMANKPICCRSRRFCRCCPSRELTGETTNVVFQL